MDPSSSTQHTEPTPNHNSMDPVLYKAVKNGDLGYLDQHSDQFGNQVTPIHNTVLHVAALFRKLESVGKILEKKPDLIRQLNVKNENPLHIAVREQHQDIVEALINSAKKLDQEDPKSSVPQLLQMLMATNVDGDTPLHLAAREGDDTFVTLLVNNHKAFQHPQYTHKDFQPSPNKAGETPLFLAAERKNGASMVESILASELRDYTGPSRKTALHAAASSGNRESIRMLLKGNMELIDKADEEGWTPLHYAAYCGNRNAVKEILEWKRSVGYIPIAEKQYIPIAEKHDNIAIAEKHDNIAEKHDNIAIAEKHDNIRIAEKHDKGIALHIAAAAGHEGVIEEMLLHCPDCWEMVNCKGQNILHIAVDKKAECVIDYITRSETDMLASLMNQKDNGGNTPRHLLASSGMKHMVEVIDQAIANMYAVNKQNKSPAEIAISIVENNGSSWFSKACCWRNIGSDEQCKAKMTRGESERKEDEDKAKAKNKISDIHMLVATLIATISFAAGFTIPGGYEATDNSDKGMAVLMQKAGFKAFVIANTIAVMCSTSSILLYAIGTLYNDANKKATCNCKAFVLVVIAIIAVTVSFLSGTYAILVHSLGVTIATSAIAGFWLLLYLSEPICFYFYIKFQGQ